MIIRTILLAVCLFVITPFIHALIGWLIPTSQSITGDPNLMYLIPMLLVQVVLMIVVFNLVKDYLPFKTNWQKGMMFTALFLISVQIPSTFGLIAYEAQAQWSFFTQAKIANYLTIFGDIIVWLIIGLLMGKFFSAKKFDGNQITNLKIPMLISAISFPLILFAVMRIFYSLIFVNDTHAPFSDF